MSGTPHACRGADWNEAVSQNNSKKKVARVGAWTGTLRNPARYLWHGCPTVGPTSSVRQCICVPSHV